MSSNYPNDRDDSNFADDTSMNHNSLSPFFPNELNAKKNIIKRLQVLPGVSSSYVNHFGPSLSSISRNIAFISKTSSSTLFNLLSVSPSSTETDVELRGSSIWNSLPNFDGM